MNKDFIKRFKNSMTGAVLTIAMLPGFSTCGSEDEPTPPAPSPPEKVGRTVLVYMVANNTLGMGSFDNGVKGFDGLDLEEMKIAAKNGDLGGNRLIVYHVPRNGDVAIKEIMPNGEIEVLETLDREEYSTSASRMRYVFSEVRDLAPADRYGLVLWSHGSGWLEDGIEEVVSGKNASGLRSFGDDNGKRMNVSTLADVLEGEGFDYVYFDCCHMASVEVAYELRNATDMIVGSASELPSKGMPYDTTLRYIMADEPDLIGAAASVFNTYNALNGWDRTCTMSVIDTSVMDDLAVSVRKLMEEAPSAVSAEGVQKFLNKGRYYDLENYLEKLAEGNENMAEELIEVKRKIGETVIYSAATPYLWEGLSNNVKITRHCGLSTNIVGSAGDEAENNYDRLEWWQDVASALWENND